MNDRDFVILGQAPGVVRFGLADPFPRRASYPITVKLPENTRTYLDSDLNVALMDTGSLVQPGRQLESFRKVEELAGTLEIPERPSMTAGYADIYCGFWITPQGERVQVAVKELRTPIPKDRRTGEEALKTKVDTRLRREIFIWSQIKHPNLHALLGYCSEPKPRLISAWCQHGNMTDYLQANPDLTPCDKLRLIYQAACGLEHLHSRVPPICHADIKPENVLINDRPGATLSDFGLSRVVQDIEARSGFTTTETIKGTRNYMAIELFNGQKPNLASDVYAFGGFILTVMSGKPPFDGLSFGATVGRVLQGKPPIPEDHPNLPDYDSLWKPMRRCWDKDPTARPTIREVMELLEQIMHEESNPQPRPGPASLTDDGAYWGAYERRGAGIDARAADAQIPLGAPGSRSTSSAGVPSNLLPIPSGVVAGRIRRRESDDELGSTFRRGPLDQPRHTGPGHAVRLVFNAEGQRMCRQCGQPGRYKDGKCVERWGPGPAGAGTVCSRCRKKMKRVERRGTQDAGSLGQRLPLGVLAPNQQQPPLSPRRYYPPLSQPSYPREGQQYSPSEVAPAREFWCEWPKLEGSKQLPSAKPREKRRAPTYSPSPPPVVKGDARSSKSASQPEMESDAEVLEEVAGVGDEVVSPSDTTAKDKDGEQDADGDCNMGYPLGEEEDADAEPSANAGSATGGPDSDQDRSRQNAGSLGQHLPLGVLIPDQQQPQLSPRQYYPPLPQPSYPREGQQYSPSEVAPAREFRFEWPELEESKQPPSAKPREKRRAPTYSPSPSPELEESNQPPSAKPREKRRAPTYSPSPSPEVEGDARSSKFVSPGNAEFLYTWGTNTSYS